MKSDKCQRPHRKGPSIIRPSNSREWALCRVGLSCKLGRDALEGKNIPATYSGVEYALFNLLHAVEDLACAMGQNVAGERPLPAGDKS